MNTEQKEMESEHVTEIQRLELEFEASQEKCTRILRELEGLKQKLKQSETKCLNMSNDRIKYVELSSKLTAENKSLYKRWFQLKKNETRFRQLIVQQLKSFTHQQQQQQQQQLKRKVAKKDESKSVEKLPMIKKQQQQQQKAATAFDTSKFVKKKIYEQLLEEKCDLEIKFNKLKADNEKVSADLSLNDIKLKQLRIQNEAYGNEASYLKKRELELRAKVENGKNQEDEQREEMKKNYEAKIKTLSSDLTKHISSNKTLRNENEKLNDKIKVNNEKINHMERDNNQKRQLLEFYKKKIEESQTFKYEIDHEPIVSDYKGQIKKLSAANEKMKERFKGLESEKAAMELKLDVNEKLAAEQTVKVDALKKEKIKLEQTLKAYKKKATDLESFIEKFEQTAETNIKCLSETSKETLDIAQYRIAAAFKLADSYENILKNLYESLINHSIVLRKKICEKKVKNKQKIEIEHLKDDDNMRTAMDLAGNLLNLTANELDDIFTYSNLGSVGDGELHGAGDGLIFDELANRKRKMMLDFEQFLSASKKDKQRSAFSSNASSFGEFNNRIEDLLNSEREFLCIKLY